MASKSIVQRIVEGIAIVLVAIIAVPVVVAIGSRFWPKQAAPVKKPEPAQPAAVASPEPQRESVDSVAKLPATYPAIAELVQLTDPPTAPRGQIPTAESSTLEGISVRHLNAYAGSEVTLSPGDAKIAIVEERTPARTVRLAVWDVESGKLLRFLSSEVGQGARPYAGKENADFGAEVDLKDVQRPVFSPSGKRFAVRQRMAALVEGVSAYIWDVVDGKLLSRFDDACRPLDAFDFPHDDYLVLGVSYGQRDSSAMLREGMNTIVIRQFDRTLLRIAASTGEAELLAPIGVGANDFGQNAVREGQIAFCDQGLHTIDVVTRQHLHGEVAAGNRSSYHVMWYSPDGTKIYGCSANGKLDAWDVATRRRLETSQLLEANNITPILAAPEAGLVMLHDGPSRNVNAFDVATGKLVSVVNLPFRNGKLKAISSDARRLLVSTDRLSLLVVDFPQGLPAGVIDLAKVLGKMKLPATR